MRQIVNGFKSLATVAIIFLIFRFTGIMNEVSYYSQSAVMATGLMDAGDDYNGNDSFSYNFSIKDLNGHANSFEEYKGKVVFLNLWATWCGPCRAEMPTIEKLYQASDTSKIAFVILSIDRERDKPKIVSYINSNRFTFPVYQPNGDVPEMLKVPSIPTTFIIAKDGRVASKEVGVTNFNTARFKKFLSKLVNE